MNKQFDDRLEKATESAFGRFVYRFVFPGTLALVCWLGVRAINALDRSIVDLKASNTSQVEVQSRIQGDVQAIRAQMDYQTRYQSLIDSQQNERLDLHDRALKLK